MSAMKMVLVAQTLAVSGGVTDSIFPQVEAVLLVSSDHQSALEFVSSRKKMDRYKSVMDYLFCELHPEWRLACRRYYVGNGPQLKNQLTDEQLATYNKRLLIALGVAYELFCEKRRLSWTKYRKCVADELKLAA